MMTYVFWVCVWSHEHECFEAVENLSELLFTLYGEFCALIPSERKRFMLPNKMCIYYCSVAAFTQLPRATVTSQRHVATTNGSRTRCHVTTGIAVTAWIVTRSTELCERRWFWKRCHTVKASCRHPILVVWMTWSRSVRLPGVIKKRVLSIICIFV